ncbi:ABC transporter permease [Spirochaetia bacterium]|nr:ABC transporter permease [Spirochaetia bacterium]
MMFHFSKLKPGSLVIGFFMLLISFLTLYPVWYTVVLSFNDSRDALFGGIYWFPRKFSLISYRQVFRNSDIIKAFNISFWRTIIGTVTSVFFTSMVAYAFSKKHIMGNRVYLIMGTITMFFGGGLIPYFLVIKTIGLYDKFLMYIIPAMFSFWNCIIFMSFFRAMPAAMEESAKIDGANDFVIFLRIVLPLSTAVLATIALFNGVYHWNDYFTGVMYFNNPDMLPIQTYLYRIIAASNIQSARENMPMDMVSAQISGESLKLATMVVTTAPVVCVYPFLQRYFVKGVMIGSIKG